MSADPSTVLSALAAALRSEPGRPLVTMYDQATGERVELSVATFDNWVSKLANLFTAEWELEPGDRVAIALPPHWQAMVTAVAAWTAGLTVSLGLPGPVAASVVGPAWDGNPAPAGHLLACSLRPLGGGFADPLPKGRLDWAEEVPAQPDALLMPQPVAPTDVAVATATAVWTHADLVRRGLGAAGTTGLAAGGRLLTDASPSDPAGIDIALLAPLVTGSSVVLLINAEPAQVESVAHQERVTCQALASQGLSTPPTKADS